MPCWWGCVIIEEKNKESKRKDKKWHHSFACIILGHSLDILSRTKGHCICWSTLSLNTNNRPLRFVHIMNNLKVHGKAFAFLHFFPFSSTNLFIFLLFYFALSRYICRAISAYYSVKEQEKDYQV